MMQWSQSVHFSKQIIMPNMTIVFIIHLVQNPEIQEDSGALCRVPVLFSVSSMLRTSRSALANAGQVHSGRTSGSQHSQDV